MYWLVQMEFMLRLIAAGACGCWIGYERRARMKEAGVRTHMVVAVGAALMMIVSKYGFFDILQYKGISLDPSRVAAQIVSGIGFLGAGMIFVRKQAISGLTTAAGVWTTAGIGMAIGAKLYFIGIAATVFVVFIQGILYKHYTWFRLPSSEQIDMVLSGSDDSIGFIQDTFAQHRIEVLNVKAERNAEGHLDVELFIKLPRDYKVSELMSLFKDSPHVLSIEY